MAHCSQPIPSGCSGRVGHTDVQIPAFLKPVVVGHKVGTFGTFLCQRGQGGAPEETHA